MLPYLRLEVDIASTLSQTNMEAHMGGCQNYGPFLSTLNIRGRIVIGTQKGTIILATTHVSYSLNSVKGGYIGGDIGAINCRDF